MFYLIRASRWSVRFVHRKNSHKTAKGRRTTRDERGRGCGRAHFARSRKCTGSTLLSKKVLRWRSAVGASCGGEVSGFRGRHPCNWLLVAASTQSVGQLSSRGKGPQRCSSALLHAKGRACKLSGKGTQRQTEVFFLQRLQIRNFRGCNSHSPPPRRVHAAVNCETKAPRGKSKD